MVNPNYTIMLVLTIYRFSFKRMLHPDLAPNKKKKPKQKYRQQQRHDVTLASYAVDVQGYCNCADYTQILKMLLFLFNPTLICLYILL